MSGPVEVGAAAHQAPKARAAASIWAMPTMAMTGIEARIRLARLEMRTVMSVVPLFRLSSASLRCGDQRYREGLVERPVKLAS